ncbi:MAG: hypothetical protein IPL11_09920 [Candidatus Accumulibacter sp.]|nr:hypothetical protein [Accumulibacter sp.]
MLMMIVVVSLWKKQGRRYPASSPSPELIRDGTANCRSLYSNRLEQLLPTS